MSAKQVFLAAILGTCWSWCVARGQEPNQPGAAPPPAPVRPEGVPAQSVSTTVAEEGTGLSSWITYERHDCCIGKGGGMPILMEGFFRVGPATPIGGGYLSTNLSTGWALEVGARTMFFNHAWTDACAVELGISNAYTPSTLGTATQGIFMNNSVNTSVSVRALNRNCAYAGVGYERYLLAPANDCEGCHVRVGADIGGRYGAATIRFNEIPHRTQVIEATYVAIHSDVELPHGRWTYLAGGRMEYGMTWSSIFGPGVSAMQDLLFLVNVGARY